MNAHDLHTVWLAVWNAALREGLEPHQALTKADAAINILSKAR